MELGELLDALPVITRDADNDYFKSRYATLAHIRAKIDPVLKEHGFYLLQRIKWEEDGAGSVQSELMRRDSAEQSGPVLSCSFPIVAVKETPQALGSGVTYARRYGIIALLNLVIEGEDDDGNEASEPVPKKRTAPTPPEDPLTDEDTSKLIEYVKGIDLTSSDLIDAMEEVAGVRKAKFFPKSRLRELKEALWKKGEKF